MAFKLCERRFENLIIIPFNILHFTAQCPLRFNNNHGNDKSTSRINKPALWLLKNIPHRVTQTNYFSRWYTSPISVLIEISYLNTISANLRRTAISWSVCLCKWSSSNARDPKLNKPDRAPPSIFKGLFLRPPYEPSPHPVDPEAPLGPSGGPSYQKFPAWPRRSTANMGVHFPSLALHGGWTYQRLCFTRVAST